MIATWRAKKGILSLNQNSGESVQDEWAQLTVPAELPPSVVITDVVGKALEMLAGHADSEKSLPKAKMFARSKG